MTARDFITPKKDALFPFFQWKNTLTTPIIRADMIAGFVGALAITLLALTEAIAIAQSIALRSGQRIKSNQELFGQGLSNIAGSFFSAYPASGSFNRSGLNYEAGAKTPLASVFSAIFLVIIVLFFGSLAAYLPLAVMAAILFLVAWGLIDFRHIRNIQKTSHREFAILIVTFLATLFLELEFAIFVGVFLSIALYLEHSSKTTVSRYLPDPNHSARRFRCGIDLPHCPQLSIVRIDGSLFFGSLASIEHEFSLIAEEHPDERHILVVADSVPVIDVVSAEFLVREQKRRQAVGGNLYLSNLRPKVEHELRKWGYFQKLGQQNIFDSKTEAIADIVGNRLDNDRCRACTARIFHECTGKPKA